MGGFGTAAVIARLAATRTAQAIRRRVAKSALRVNIKTMGGELHAKAAVLVSSRVPAVRQPAPLVAPDSTRTKRAEMRASRVLQVSFKIKRTKVTVRPAVVGNMGGP